MRDKVRPHQVREELMCRDQQSTGFRRNQAHCRQNARQGHQRDSQQSQSMDCACKRSIIRCGQAPTPKFESVEAKIGDDSLNPVAGEPGKQRAQFRFSVPHNRPYPKYTENAKGGVAAIFVQSEEYISRSTGAWAFHQQTDGKLVYDRDQQKGMHDLRKYGTPTQIRAEHRLFINLIVSIRHGRSILSSW